MEIDKAIPKIWNTDIREMVKEIYNEYKDRAKELPTSLSNKYHLGETLQEHIEFSLDWLFFLMEEFRLSAIQKDYLIAGIILHDISNALNNTKEPNPEEYQKKYDTGYFRSKEAYTYHPTLSAFIIGKYIVDKKKNIPELINVAQLVQTHMSHWLGGYNPEPSDLIEYILCTVDFLASRKELPKMENNKK